MSISTRLEIDQAKLKANMLNDKIHFLIKGIFIMYTLSELALRYERCILYLSLELMTQNHAFPQCRQASTEKTKRSFGDLVFKKTWDLAKRELLILTWFIKSLAVNNL